MDFWNKVHLTLTSYPTVDASEIWNISANWSFSQYEVEMFFVSRKGSCVGSFGDLLRILPYGKSSPLFATAIWGIFTLFLPSTQQANLRWMIDIRGLKKVIWNEFNKPGNMVTGPFIFADEKTLPLPIEIESFEANAMTYSSLLNVCAKAGDYLSLGRYFVQKMVEKKNGCFH